MGISILQKEILCPFCFETFHFRDAWFRCRNPSPTECPLELDKPYSDHMGRPHTLSKAFPPQRAGSWGRNNHKATCPQCGTSTTIRLCEHCHSRLPSQVENVDSKILAVIGGMSSGKSHYIATLVQQLTSVLGPSMSIRVMPIGDSTRKNYDKYYREPVYQNKLVLPQTQSARTNPVVREPLIYRLEFPERWFGVPVVNLVLFDAAGEDVQDENTLALYNKYMIHAAGIIFLISPSQVPAICEQIRIPRDGEPFEHVLSRVVELFESEGRLPAGRQIGVPTAFVLSKSDMLAGIVDNSCEFLRDVPHSGSYDPRESEMVHEEIKGYLASWGADGLMSIGEKFRRHSFFAVSALGCKPENNTIPRIDPIRCGDPLLWVLHEIGCERFGWGSIGRLIGRGTRLSAWIVAIYMALLAIAAFVSPMVAGIASVVALIVGAVMAIRKRDWTPAVMALGCSAATLVGTSIGSQFRALPAPPATSVPKEVATVAPKSPQPANSGTANMANGDSLVPKPTVKPLVAPPANREFYVKEDTTTAKLKNRSSSAEPQKGDRVILNRDRASVPGPGRPIVPTPGFVPDTVPPPPAPYRPRTDGKVLTAQGDYVEVDLGQRDGIKKNLLLVIRNSLNPAELYAFVEIVGNETSDARLMSRRPFLPQPGNKVSVQRRSSVGLEER